MPPDSNATRSIQHFHDDEATVPPEIICGYSRRKGAMAVGLTSLTTLYIVLLKYFKDSSSYLPPAPEFCPPEDKNSPPCSRPDLISFEIISGICILYCGISGGLAWTRQTKSAFQTTEARLFGYLPQSEALAAVNFTFQVWDFFTSLTISEHGTVVFLIHHVLAGLVSWCSLKYQYLHYYGVYFLGCSEISSIFLLVMDTSRFFPPQSEGVYSGLVSLCGPPFLLTFFYYRIYEWFRVSALFWQDVLKALRDGTAEKYRPGKSFVLYAFMIANIPLTLMQVFWFFYTILPNTFRHLGII